MGVSCHSEGADKLNPAGQFFRLEEHHVSSMFDKNFFNGQSLIFPSLRVTLVGPFALVLRNRADYAMFRELNYNPRNDT